MTGKRKVGRPKAPPTEVIRIRLPIAVHAKIIDKGGDVWVKRLINEAIDGDRPAFERGFYEGFLASGEGFNSEYPPDVMTADNGYKAALREAIEKEVK